MLPGMNESKASLYELNELTGSHEQIIRLSRLGWAAKDIAKEVGCTNLKVCYTINGALGLDKGEELSAMMDAETADIGKQIHETALQAIKLLGSVVRGDEQEADMKSRIDASKHVLGMDGHSPISRSQVDLRAGYIQQEGMEGIRERAEKLRLIKKAESPEVVS